MVSQMEDFTSSKAFRVSGKKAFDEAGIKHSDVDHLMIYDAFAHLPLYGLEDLGFCKPGEAAGFVRDRHTAIENAGKPGSLALNTNGGGLSYMHSGMYGMHGDAGEHPAAARSRPGAGCREPRSRSATASAACSAPPAPSSGSNEAP